MKTEEQSIIELCKVDIYETKEIKQEVKEEYNISEKASLRKKKGKKTCPHCNYATYSVSDMRVHVRIHGERPYECDKCPKAFNKPSTLRIHKLSHTHEKQFQCEICNKEFKLIQGYNRHLKLHENVKKYACDKCDYKSCLKDKLREHVTRHVEVATIKCELCDSMFKSNAAKNQHMQVHNKAHYTCKVCSKDILGYRNLKAHMNRIHVHNYINKTIECDLCRYTTTSVLTFKSHMMRHEDKLGSNKKFVCEHCEYIANSNRVLVNHMKLHNDELSEKCHLCSFNTRCHKRLKVHIKKIHTGVKNIECLDCNEMFLTQKEMELHKKRTHKLKPQCERCSKTFAYSYVLNRHRKICESKQDPIILNKADIKEEEEEVIEDEFRQRCGMFENIDIKEEGVQF